MSLLGLLIAGCAIDPQRQLIDQVNAHTQRDVAYAGGVKWSLGDKGDCTTFALHNLRALRAQGLPATAWLVWDEVGDSHAVVVSGDSVLDSRYRRVETRQALEQIGYRFRFPLTDREVSDLVRDFNPRTGAASIGKGRVAGDFGSA